jgi:hypothetical protein
MSSTPPGGRVHQRVVLVRDIGRRVQRRAEPKRPSDLELRHLRSLMRAYDAATGPEVLVFGDSIMYWTVREPDRRRTFDMIRDEMKADPKCMVLAGAGYNARMVIAFLSALSACRSRPRVVVVPMSLVTLMSAFLDHPERGLARAAQAVRSAVEGWPDLPKRYEKPGHEEWAAFDRLSAPSLIGQRRTMGELELFLNASSSSPSQRATRQRNILDAYTGERLEPESPGVRLVAEMAGVLRSMNLRSVVYITPTNYELTEKVLGEGARAHIERNAEVAASAFLGSAGGLGMVVNRIVACPAAEFSDPLHLTQQGRHRLAQGIAAGLDQQLATDSRLSRSSSQFHSDLDRRTPGRVAADSLAVAAPTRLRHGGRISSRQSQVLA